MSAPFLLEIGCEEIPARMIAAAAEDLRQRVTGVLETAGLAHGAAIAWGGPRRLAVHVASVAQALSGGEELVLGPPAAVAFREDGTPSPAGLGFASKQGIEATALQRIETEKGIYTGFRRAVAARPLEQVLQATLPAAVAAMSFPKMMRWGTGAHRFVRPVHWVVALHGADVVRLEVVGRASGRVSEGHRFLASGPVSIDHADRYVDALRAAHVLVTPDSRSDPLQRALAAAAATVGG